MCIAPWLSNKVAMIQEYFLPIKLPRFARLAKQLLRSLLLGEFPPLLRLLLLFCTSSA